jgi:ABC-type multidrug transport system fused ATPase/permease subunit
LDNEEVGSSSELMDMNVKIEKGELFAVIDKASFILSILNELNHKKSEKFKFSANASMSLVAQRSWIRNESVKTNILFGYEYNEKSYKKEMRLSALEEDMESFPQGDKAIIGDKRVNISYTQKTRVATSCF